MTSTRRCPALTSRSTSRDWLQASPWPRWQQSFRTSGHARPRPPRSKPTAPACAPLPSCHRLRSGTAGSSCGAKSKISRTACSGDSSMPSSPRRAKGSSKMTTSPISSCRQARIVDKPPLTYHFTRKRDARHRVNAERMFASYQNRLTPERLCLFDRYSLSDIAFKAVGVGSVGTFCAIGLFASGDGAPLFLQVKEAGKSVLERLGAKFNGHPGRRVVEGQHIMQAASDVLLGWTQDEASGSTFLRAPTEEPAARVGQRTRRGECPRQLRALMRAHARARTCTLGRSSCARGIHGKERRL